MGKNIIIIFLFLIILGVSYYADSLNDEIKLIKRENKYELDSVRWRCFWNHYQAIIDSNKIKIVHMYYSPQNWKK